MLVIYDGFIFSRGGKWRRDNGLGKNFKKQKRVGSKAKAGEPGPIKAAGSLIDALFSAFFSKCPCTFSYISSVHLSPFLSFCFKIL